MRQADLLYAEMILEQAVKDVRSGKLEHEEWGLGELEDIATASDLRGTSVARRAREIIDEMLNSMLNSPLVNGVTFCGQPITRARLEKIRERAERRENRPEEFETFGISGRSLRISPRKYFKKQLSGPSRCRA